MAVLRRLLPLLVLVGLVAATPATAAGPALVLRGEVPSTPARFRVDARQAVRLAATEATVRQVRDDAGRALPATVARLDTWTWEVTVRRDGRTVVLVDVDGRTPAITGVAPNLEAGHVGGRLNSAWLWALLCTAFVAPFVDLRRLWRPRHLDLAVLLSFGLSQLLETRGRIDLSVPLVYPGLVYLAARMLLLARGRGRDDGPLVPHLPLWTLAAAAPALLVLHAVLALAQPGVMDVGYFSVLGADRIMHGDPIYVLGGSQGDTYGMFNYLAYVPFELLFPWHEGIADPVAAKVAAIAWDVLVAGLLVLCGRRLQAGRAGLRLGVALAYAWAAYPWAMYATGLATNDVLVAALLLGAFLLAGRPLGPGALTGLAAAVKFTPAVLLAVVGRGGGRRATVLAFGAAAFAFVFPFVGHVPDGGLREIWDCTVGFQLGRASNFSPWGQHEALRPLQLAFEALALGVVATVAALPGREDPARLAAMAAAVLIAVQVPAVHWFYPYLVWFAPFALVALLGGAREAAQPPWKPASSRPSSVVGGSP